MLVKELFLIWHCIDASMTKAVLVIVRFVVLPAVAQVDASVCESAATLA